MMNKAPKKVVAKRAKRLIKLNIKQKCVRIFQKWGFALTEKNVNSRMANHKFAECSLLPRNTTEHASVIHFGVMEYVTMGLDASFLIMRFQKKQ